MDRVSRPSPSPRLARRAAARPGRGAHRWGAVLAAGRLLAASADAEAPPCGPFELAAADVADSANTEPGLAPADAGSITKLPEPVAVDGAAPRGEALLALPKTASGGLPTGIQLAPG